MPFGLKRSQFAFLVKDLKAVGDFWKKAGFPDMPVTHGPLRDAVYRGQPGQFDQELGWHRHGEIVYEWIRILKGPTVYEEYLRAHGEGPHHLGFDALDIDKVVGEWSALGFPPLQSGAWGEKAFATSTCWKPPRTWKRPRSSGCRSGTTSGTSTAPST